MSRKVVFGALIFVLFIVVITIFMAVDGRKTTIDTNEKLSTELERADGASEDTVNSLPDDIVADIDSSQFDVTSDADKGSEPLTSDGEVIMVDGEYDTSNYRFGDTNYNVDTEEAVIQTGPSEDASPSYKKDYEYCEMLQEKYKDDPQGLENALAEWFKDVPPIQREIIE